jgi:hypothetical protein
MEGLDGANHVEVVRENRILRKNRFSLSARKNSIKVVSRMRCRTIPRSQQKGDDVMRTASCQCGQLSLTVEGEPALVSVCNCTRCQKRSGSAFAVSSRWNSSQVRDRSGKGLTYVARVRQVGTSNSYFVPYVVQQ